MKDHTQGLFHYMASNLNTLLNMAGHGRRNGLSSSQTEPRQLRSWQCFGGPHLLINRGPTTSLKQALSKKLHSFGTLN